uniref:Transmembrane protein 14C n=1 Tax=Cyclopterus lumpus TaxID=8103 RepID=A0A8C2XN70_CYCLU
MSADWVGYGYAALIASGGVIGYVKAGSTPSLAAGLLFGGLAGFGAYQISNDPKNIWVSLGWYTKTLVCVCVCVALRGTIHSYSTRQSSHLHPPKLLTSRGQLSIRFRGTKLWNDFFPPNKEMSFYNMFQKLPKRKSNCCFVRVFLWISVHVFLVLAVISKCLSVSLMGTCGIPIA